MQRAEKYNTLPGLKSGFDISQYLIGIKQSAPSQAAFRRKEEILSAKKIIQNLELIYIKKKNLITSFPGGSVVKNPPANVGDTGHPSSIPGLGRSPRGGMETHSSILAWRIPDRGAWQAIVHGVPKELDMTQPRRMYTCTRLKTKRYKKVKSP